MFNTRRKALLVSVALVGATGFLTACQNSDDSAAAAASQSSSPAAPADNADASSSPSAAGGDQGASTGTNTSAGTGTGSGSSKGSGSTGNGSGSGSGGGPTTGSGGQGGTLDACGANDVSLTTKSMTQAGGYILITAKAKPGISCYMPGEIPFVSFGDHIVAGPAEQAVSDKITLGGSAVAYAGLNPKSTSSNGGSTWHSITVGTAVGDPNATDVPLDATVTADKPVVTDWHSAAQDAVPLG